MSSSNTDTKKFDRQKAEADAKAFKEKLREAAKAAQQPAQQSKG